MSLAHDSTAAPALPSNVDAEQALLGAILLDNLALERVRDIVQAEHFSEPVHGRIYDAVLRIVDGGGVANGFTLNQQFRDDPALREVGGAGYIAKLVGGARPVVEARYYAELVADLAWRRELIERANRLAAEAADVTLPRQEVIEAGQADLAALGDRSAKGGAVTYSEAVQAGYQQIARAKAGEVEAVTTGLRDLDHNLAGGLHATDLIVLAGRSRMGKTTLAEQIGRAAARRRLDGDLRAGAAVGVFSLEMSAAQLAVRAISSAGGIDSERLRAGRIGDDELDRAGEAAAELARLPLYIDDTPGLSLEMIRARAKGLHRRQGIGLVIVDHLGRVGLPKNNNHTVALGEVTGGLKNLAKELGIPVLLLVQLNRGVEGRDDKRPLVSDLRESGRIEEDADVVMLLYRGEVYLRRQKPDGADEEAMRKYHERLNACAGKAELYLGKNRHGNEHIVHLAFDGAHSRFADLEKQREIF